MIRATRDNLKVGDIVYEKDHPEPFKVVGFVQPTGTVILKRKQPLWVRFMDNSEFDRREFYKDER